MSPLARRDDPPSLNPQNPWRASSFPSCILQIRDHSTRAPFLQIRDFSKRSCYKPACPSAQQNSGPSSPRHLLHRSNYFCWRVGQPLNFRVAAPSRFFEEAEGLDFYLE
jgi:hypothetical protein